MWDQSRHALTFFQNNSIPFWEMSSSNKRVSNSDWLLSSSDGKIHVLYRRKTNEPSDGINMDGLPGMYSVKWYNPRTGASLQNGSMTTLLDIGTNFSSYGNPPGPDNGKDWVLLLRKM